MSTKQSDPHDTFSSPFNIDEFIRQERGRQERVVTADNDEQGNSLKIYSIHRAADSLARDCFLLAGTVQ
jgi:hypothetical protein